MPTSPPQATTLASEDRIQQDIVTWYTNNYCLQHHIPRHVIFHVPNQRQQHLTGIGVLGGVADLIIVQARRILFVEVKTERGAQSDAQIAFQSRVEMLGYIYQVVRSLDEFQAFIQNLD